MSEAETLALYEKTGALLRGHFLLSSGLHSDTYLQSALVLQHPEYATALGASKPPGPIAPPAFGAESSNVACP